ncbi:MAG: AAA family ATPase [Methylocella sp.]
MVKRQSWTILVITLCALSLGALYLYITPPSYTAIGTMVIDTRKTQFLKEQPTVATPPVDAGAVQTEVEILKSPKISLAVIDALQLTHDPEFVGDGQDLIPRWIGSLLGAQSIMKSDAPPSEAELTDRALATFENRRSVVRAGSTYVMEIGFRSRDPAKAAKIANAIADAYLKEQLDARYETARRGGGWLQDSLTKLRTEASAAERAVVDFKRANNIVESGKGLLVNEQQLSELNTQLITARASTAEAKARLDRVDAVIDQGLPDASVADGLKSEVIVRLRNQYVDYAARERIFSARYGQNHLATVNLRTQMQEIRRNIDDQMRKIAESYKSDYEIASAREQSLTNSLKGVIAESQSTNSAQVKLLELESAAQSYRTIYDSFLQRYMDAVQQESFPINDSRLIGPAIAPTKQSQPNNLMVMGMTGAGGLAFGFCLALFREMSDRVFRTGSQVEEIFKTNCVTMLPGLKSDKASPRDDGASDRGPAATRAVPPVGDILRHAVDSPFSQFAEGLRLLQLVADLNGPAKLNRVIGVTSTLPNEGKSTIASNFAHLIAHAGERTILVDCDLRNPSLTQKIAPDASIGLVHVIAGRAEIADAMLTDPSTGLHFLPAGVTGKLLHSNKILGSLAAKHFFDQLREMFDYVIVDLPPIVPIVDTRAAANFIDSFIYVIEWARTNRRLAQDTLQKTPEVRERLLGVAMNKVDLAKMSRYEGDVSHFSYHESYARYGYVEQ